MTQPPRKCPQCHHAFVLLKDTDIYGKPLEIDQCPLCGSYWFDEGELFRLKKDFAEWVSSCGDDNSAESENTALNCPSCAQPLLLLSDRRYPPDLQARMCPRCFGMWLRPQDVMAFYNFHEDCLRKLRELEAEHAGESRPSGPAMPEMGMIFNNPEAAKKNLLRAAVGIATPWWSEIMIEAAVALVPLVKRHLEDQEKKSFSE